MKNKWLFDEKRLLILAKLLRCNEACGGDLKKCFKMKKTLLSYHLGILRANGIIEEAKRGREKWYRVKPRKADFIREVVALVR